MIVLVEFAKWTVARLYPVLVWGTLVGLVAHAGLKSQVAQSAEESERVSVFEDSADRSALP